MVTPEGIIYEREAILNYMVEQKAKIAATKKRKLKEEQEKDEEVPAKVFKVRGKKMLQWWLQIREFSLIWPEITKMANKGISNIPLFDIKVIQIWLDFVSISTSLEF